MSSTLQPVLASFRRQMVLLRAFQAAAITLFTVGMVGMIAVSSETARRGIFLALLVLVACWVLLTLRSLRIMRQVQAGGVLLSIGRLEDAEVWLRNGMNTFSLSPRVKLIAGHLLGMVLFRQGAYNQVIELCRTLLRQRPGRHGRLGVEIRLLLADSLLRLGRPDEARQVLQPIKEVSLPLESRMKLLPIMLRYHLAAGETDTAAHGMKEKLQIAELLDAPTAALVHALLAESCRRMGMTTEQAFLTERAALYHDLSTLAQTYPVIAPIVPSHTAAPATADASASNPPGGESTPLP